MRVFSNTYEQYYESRLKEGFRLVSTLIYAGWQEQNREYISHFELELRVNQFSLVRRSLTENICLF